VPPLLLPQRQLHQLPGCRCCHHASASRTSIQRLHIGAFPSVSPAGFGDLHNYCFLGRNPRIGTASDFVFGGSWLLCVCIIVDLSE